MRRKSLVLCINGIYDIYETKAARERALRAYINTLAVLGDYVSLFTLTSKGKQEGIFDGKRIEFKGAEFNEDDLFVRAIG